MFTSLIGFAIYFIIIGLIAFAAYVKGYSPKKSHYAGVILGNRSVNYFLTALSAQASDMSDWLFMAFPAALYTGGMMNGWIGIGLIGGMWATWHFIASPIRKTTEEYNCYTLSSYFERRFHDASGIIRLLSAGLALLFFAVYIAAGLKGFGFLTESIFHIPYHIGTGIAIFFALGYIGFGGYTTLAWIDCFQALFLLFVVISVPVCAFFQIHGIESIIAAAKAQQISLSFIPEDLKGLINAIFLAFSWGVCYFGMPHIVTKFMGISRLKDMKRAQYVGMFWQITVLIAAAAVGIIGIAYFPNGLQNPELIFVNMVTDLFSNLTAGFILSAVAGATLSVITAQLLVVVSLITEDLYRNARPDAADKEMIFVYRATIILISLASYAVSYYKTNTIQSLVQYAWMGLGCSFGPLLLLALHSKKINRFGARASILTGGIIAAIWHSLFQVSIFEATGFNIPAVIPGFLLSIVVAYGVSFLTKSK